MSDSGHVAGHALFDTRDPQRYKASRRVTVVSLGTNVLIATGQLLIGLLGHSQALVADGIHTLSDVVTDGMVLFALKHGAKEADREHPYGHGRIETAFIVVLGVALIAVAAGIATNAALRLADPAGLRIPAPLTLWVAAATIAAKEGLYRYTVYVARRYHSNLLRANAWHHRSDALSSVMVFVGIAGSLAGIPSLDGIAAVGVALMVARIGWELGWNAVKELVDTALEQEEVEAIRRTILAVDGVKALHLLRTRRTGGRALVDVHIVVDGRISVSEGHHISETVRATVMDRFESVTDVMVHIDPEDDEFTAPSAGLPLRTELLAELRRRLAGVLDPDLADEITLHYLHGRIHVILHLPLARAGDGAARARLRARLAEAVAGDPHIGSVELCYH